MARFKEKSGRVWEFTIGIDEAIEVKREAGIPIESLFDRERVGQWDRVTFYLALRAVLKPRNEDAFRKALSDGETAEAAAQALQEAAADFLSPTERSAALSMLSAGNEMKRLSTTATPALMQKAVSEVTRQIQAAMMLSSVHSSGGVDSPESLPDGSASGT